MTKEVSQEALLAFELFQRSPHGTESRKVLNQYLVQLAMYNDANIHIIEEIRRVVLKLLNEMISFSYQECKEALDSCSNSESITKTGDANYALTKQAKNRLFKAYELIDQAEKDFDRGLSEYVGRRLGIVIGLFAEALLFNIVKETIQNIFYRNAIKLRNLLEGKTDLANLLEADIGAEKELKERLTTFTSLQTDATIDAVIEGIKWFMANLNDSQKHYIAMLHHRVFYFQILNIDPRLQRIEDDCCKSLRIYLDTNVLVRYLCEGSSLHKPIADVIAMSKKLGIKILVSSQTLRESERLVNAAKSFSTYLEKPQIEAVLLTSQVGMNNPVIEAFLIKKRQNLQLKWSGYISPLTNLEVYLITEDIEVSDDDFDASSDKTYDLVRRAVTDVKRDLVSPEIINHDSHNLVLIQRLRDKYPAGMLGSSVWLLTIDSKLPKVDKILRRTYPSPHCKTIDQWGGVLLPFQNIGKFIATDEYVSYLVSQQLGVVFPGEVLDIQFFKELEKSDIDIEGILKLDPEIALNSLVDLQKDREARILLDQIQTVPEDEKEPAVKAFYERALSILSNYKEDEKQRDKREIGRLQKGIQQLTDELRDLESARVKDKDRLKSVRQNLKETQEKLTIYRKMPLWQRVKFLLGK
jgi:hypothetical protein